MIRSQFLDAETQKTLFAIMKDSKEESRVTKKAHAILLLNDGLKPFEVAKVMYLDDDTIRYWYNQFRQKGITLLSEFGYKGRSCNLTNDQQKSLKNWIQKTIPRSTNVIGAWIDKNFGICYTRSAIIKLLNRLDIEYCKPKTISKNLNVEKQKSFIDEYNALLKNLPDNECVLFVDAVHPTHAVKPVGCWAPKGEKVLFEQTSGRQRLNIHGAINLETGATNIIDVLTADAQSTIRLFQSIENTYKEKTRIHLFLDNARYHHAIMVRDWLKEPNRKIILHFFPTYCPHLVPIERLWGLMHRNITHNKSYAKFKDFCDAILNFLRDEVPKNWNLYCDSVTDNFRIINPADFRVLKT